MPRTITNEEFIQRIKNINPNIEPLEPYINGKTKILFRCKTCHFEWKTKPEVILYSKSGCPKCTNHYQRTDKEFKEEIYKLLPNITILSEIKTTQAKILCKCDIDGYEWYSNANTLLQGHGCRECYRKSMIKDERDFIKEATSNNYITVLGKYEGYSKKILVQCNECNRKFLMFPINVLSNKRCVKCYNKEKTRSHDDFVVEVKKIHKNIDIIKPYINSHTNVSCKCTICNYEWESNPNNLLKGYGCARCAGHIKTHEDFIKRFNEVNINTNIIFLSKYQDSRTPILCKCSNDSFEWNAIPSNLLRGTGCPKCSKSHGENEISKLLDDNNISYEIQKKFDGLVGVGNRKLSYDFFIPSDNILIEYNGIQHYEYVKRFGSEERFINQQEHDRRKREYAKQNNIKLVEIPYWEFDNIKEILSKELGLVA